MTIKWDEQRHSSGIAEIDAQHKELFNQLNSLLDAMKAGKGRTEIDKLVSFLESYTVKHFSCEEKHMEERKCKACAANKAAHAQFVSKFRSFKEELGKSGSNTALVLRMQNELCQWLDQHIAGIDSQLKNTSSR